jgi:hypothetical protein
VLEQVPLFSVSQFQDDGRTGEFSYVPSSGWKTGEYLFKATLYDGENIVQESLLHNLLVPPQAITKVVSWWTLGVVIGSASILIVAVLAVIIHRRRDMLRY